MKQRLDTGWAWIVLLASFMINILCAGVFSSFGVFLVPWQEQLSGSVTKLQWTLSLAVGIPMIIGPITNALCKYYSIRLVVIVGAMFAASAFVAAWFATSVKHLYLCFAVAGVGFGLYYQPSLVVLAYYFEKRLARANGISSAGTGIGNFAMPPLFQILINQYGWNGALLVLSGLLANVAVFGALYRVSDLELKSKLHARNDNDKSTDHCKVDEGPVRLELTRTSKAQSMEIIETQAMECNNSAKRDETKYTKNCNSGFLTDIMASFNFNLLQDIRFIRLFLANCPYGLGYVIVTSYLPAKVIHGGIPNIKAAFLLSIMGIVSVVVRFTHGFLIDYNILSASMLTAMAFLLAGISCALFPVSNDYGILAFLSVLFGIAAGIFNGTVPVVAKEFVGVKRVSGAVGLLLLSTGVGVFIGLFLTGILYDMTESYTIAFLLAGAAFLTSSVLLFVDPLMRCFT